MATTAQIASNDSTTGCVTESKSSLTRILCENFSKVIAFFKVNSTSVLVQQGNLGCNVSVKLWFSKFSNLIWYPESYTDVIFACLPLKSSTSNVVDTVTIRWPLLRTTAAQVAWNDLTTRCIQNLWRGYFSVIAFFKVNSTSVLA
jgi:hypothetical protein